MDAELLPPEGQAREREISIGAYLARQRRLRGISVAELADLTKIPTRSIERLESGAFDRDPDGFVRGFVRAVAVALGLDPEETIMRMLGEPIELVGAPKGPILLLDPRLLVVVALLAAILGFGLAIWGLASRVSSPSAGEDTPKIVYRRDAVRALADEQARKEGAPQRDAGGSESVGSPGDQHPN